MSARGNWSDLTGYYFTTFTTNGDLDRRGRIHQVIGNEYFVVELFDLTDDTALHYAVAPVSELTRRGEYWHLFHDNQRDAWLADKKA
jgi:hypothetical protein